MFLSYSRILVVFIVIIFVSYLGFVDYKPFSPKELSIATNSDFLIPISLQHNVLDLRYFKLLVLLDHII